MFLIGYISVVIKGSYKNREAETVKTNPNIRFNKTIYFHSDVKCIGESYIYIMLNIAPYFGSISRLPWVTPH